MKKFLIILTVLLVILILVVVITNIVYNSNSENYIYSYDCCDFSTGILWEAPCECEQDKTIFEKTLIVLGVK